VSFCSKCEGLFSRLEGFGLCFAPNVRDFSRVWMSGVGTVPYNRQSTRVLCVGALLRAAELRENRLNVNPGNTGARRSVFPVPDSCCNVSL